MAQRHMLRPVAEVGRPPLQPEEPQGSPEGIEPRGGRRQGRQLEWPNLMPPLPPLLFIDNQCRWGEGRRGRHGPGRTAAGG